MHCERDYIFTLSTRDGQRFLPPAARSGFQSKKEPCHVDQHEKPNGLDRAKATQRLDWPGLLDRMLFLLRYAQCTTILLAVANNGTLVCICKSLHDRVAL